jgi:uncharacterized membrane protein YbhN (UPF0104 family)
MSDTGRKIARFLLRLTVTAAMLYWVGRRIDFGEFRQAAQTTRWPFVGTTWLLVALFSLVQSVALRIILRRQDCHVRLNTLFGASSITALYSLVLPGILSTGVKWYILKRDTGKGSEVLSSMIYNQISLFVSTSVIGLASVPLLTPAVLGISSQQRWILSGVSALLLILIVSSFVLLVSPRTGGFAVRVLDWLLRPWPRKLARKGQEMLGQIALFQTAGAGFHLRVTWINVVNTLLVGTLLYFSAARAADIHVPFGTLVCLYASVYVLSKLPVTMANLGFREATLVGLLSGYGVAPSSALLMSMVLLSSLVFMAALGVAYQLLWWGDGTGRARRGPAMLESTPDSDMENAEETK